MDVRVRHPGAAHSTGRLKVSFTATSLLTNDNTLVTEEFFNKRHSSHTVLSLHGFNIGDILLL